jgi:hypothetical protein
MSTEIFHGPKGVLGSLPGFWQGQIQRLSVESIEVINVAQKKINFDDACIS